MAHQIKMETRKQWECVQHCACNASESAIQKADYRERKHWCAAAPPDVTHNRSGYSCSHKTVTEKNPNYFIQCLHILRSHTAAEVRITQSDSLEKESQTPAPLGSGSRLRSLLLSLAGSELF